MRESRNLISRISLITTKLDGPKRNRLRKSKARASTIQSGKRKLHSDKLKYRKQLNSVSKSLKSFVPRKRTEKRKSRNNPHPNPTASLRILHAVPQTIFESSTTPDLRLTCFIQYITEMLGLIHNKMHRTNRNIHLTYLQLYARCLSSPSEGRSMAGLRPPESRVFIPNVASAVLPISEEITACPCASRPESLHPHVPPVLPRAPYKIMVKFMCQACICCYNGFDFDDVRVFATETACYRLSRTSLAASLRTLRAA